MKALPDVRLEVTFVDGTVGVVEVRVFLENVTVDGTVFSPCAIRSRLRK